MLDQVSFTGNLAALFYRGVNPNDRQDIRSCEVAFKNLALHYIEITWPSILPDVGFDDQKLQMMLRRFYRDAFGVFHFQNKIASICRDEQVTKSVISEAKQLSVRVNSHNPRKTRIAASFSLWMATFRPIYLKRMPPEDLQSLLHLDALVNFYLATSYLEFYGSIEIGLPGRDRTIRLRRIFYDFTVRDLNLSSLELLYCSIFRPDTDSAEDFVEEPMLI